MQQTIIQGCIFKKKNFAQSPMFYILSPTLISITKGWKPNKEQIPNGSWK